MVVTSIVFSVVKCGSTNGIMDSGRAAYIAYIVVPPISLLLSSRTHSAQGAP